MCDQEKHDEYSCADSYPGSFNQCCHSKGRSRGDKRDGRGDHARAGEIADRLRELADAIRDHTKVAHRHITAFYDKASSLLEAIPALQRQLDGVDQLARFGGLEKSKGLMRVRALQTLESVGNEPEVQGIREDIPAFLKKGPADFEDREL